jgi:hypothetical protein
LRSTLDNIVANSTCGTYCFFCVARFNTALFLREIRPNTGVAICLQFESDRKTIVLSLLLYTIHNAGEVLDVVAKLMRYNVRLREIAGRLELATQLVKKSEVEV